MQPITIAQLRELRRRTNAGVMECRQALEATGGHLALAESLLSRKAAEEAERRAARRTGEGLVGSYVHHNQRLAAIVELQCETDFVARTEVFRALLAQLAEHVAAANPLAIEAAALAPSLVDEKRRELAERARLDGAASLDVEAELAGFVRASVLLSQPWIREPSRTVGDLVTAASAQVGERLRVGRIARFQVGER